MSDDQLLEYRVTKLEQAVEDIREAVTDGGRRRFIEMVTVGAALIAAASSIAHWFH